MDTDQPDQTETNSLTALWKYPETSRCSPYLVKRQVLMISSKYDQQRQQIIVKNFAKNVTVLSTQSDIQRRFCPSTVQRLKKIDFRKEWDNCFILS